MNLQEFIDYRKTCPICEGALTTGFYSSRKQTVKYEDDRINFIFPLESLKKSHKIAYSFSLYEPTFTIEFYTNAGERYCNRVPEFLRQQFLELHNNLKAEQFNFHRYCRNKACQRYEYRSEYFSIELQTTSFQPIEIYSEFFGLVYLLSNQENQYRVYKMNNIIPDKKTFLSFWKGHPGEAAIVERGTTSNVTHLELPLIPFISKEKTLNRLNSLLIYI